MSIRIQDYSEKLVFTSGMRCRKLIGVGEKFSNGMIFFFSLLNETWYRFWISECILYWSEGVPDKENDLDLGEKYFNVLSELSLNESELKLYEINIKNCILTLTINDNEIIFENIDNTTSETVVYISKKGLRV